MSDFTVDTGAIRFHARKLRSLGDEVHSDLGGALMMGGADMYGQAVNLVLSAPLSQISRSLCETIQIVPELLQGQAGRLEGDATRYDEGEEAGAAAATQSVSDLTGQGN